MITNRTLIVPEKLGSKIKELRLELGMSQSDLCNDFINLRTLQKIEKGETTPTFEVLLHIANMLHIEMFDLILSSRIPYYLEYQFPTLMNLLEEDSHHQLQELEATLKEFTDVKLPHSDHVKIDTMYAILQTFMHENRDEALQILTTQIAKLVLKQNTTPSDTDLFQIAAYIRLEKNEALLETFLQNLQNYPLYYYQASVAYNINMVFYTQKRWFEMEQLSTAVLNNISPDQSFSLLPYHYCQLGVALHKQGKGRSAFFFDKGLELLILLRQPQSFEMMLIQAKNDCIPISVDAYIDVLVEV
ncbi:MAG: helix-turn-helix domain-containing protein [Culicoidibacterales bacterium]